MSTDPRPRALPAAVVGRAIQESAVPRLARGFVPVAVAFVAGGAGAAAGAFRGPSAWVLVLGAPVTAAAMLAYALRVVQRAFGRPHRPWMTMASAAAVLPPAYGLWVLAWPGLRTVARGGGGTSLLSGLIMTVIGLWILRSWSRIVEVRRLATAILGPDGTPAAPGDVATDAPPDMGAEATR